MIENRLSERLISYWDGLRRGEPLADFARFNTESIADIWPQCIIFTVGPEAEGKPHAISFTRIGDKVRTIYSGDMIGRTFHTSQKHFPAAAIVRRMDQVIKEPRMMTDTGQFVSENSKIVKYRSCLLPFGSNGKVTHVVVGLSWREY